MTPRSSSSPGPPRRADGRSCCQAPLTSAAHSCQLQLPRVGACQGCRAVDAAHDQLVAGGAMDEADVRLGGQAAADARGAHRGEERPALVARDLEAVLAETR